MPICGGDMTPEMALKEPWQKRLLRTVPWPRLDRNCVVYIMEYNGQFKTSQVKQFHIVLASFAAPVNVCMISKTLPLTVIVQTILLEPFYKTTTGNLNEIAKIKNSWSSVVRWTTNCTAREDVTGTRRHKQCCTRQTPLSDRYGRLATVEGQCSVSPISEAAEQCAYIVHFIR